MSWNESSSSSTTSNNSANKKPRTLAARLFDEHASPTRHVALDAHKENLENHETKLLTQDNDDKAAAEEQEEEEEEEDAVETKIDFWDTPQAEMLKQDNVAKKTLAIFWQGSQRRDQGVMVLEEAFLQSKLAMEATLKEGFPYKVVEQFKAEWKSVFEKLNTELEATFQKNTEKRLEMQQRLNKYDENWQRQYRALAFRIQDVPNPEEAKEEEMADDSFGQDANESMPAGGLGQEVTKDAIAAQDESSPSKNSDASSDGPDCTMLLDQDHTPTVNRINRFLKTRERLEAAEEEFDASFDDIRAKLDAVTESVVKIAFDVASQLANSLEEDESDLQQYLVENYYRRNALEVALQEQKKQTEDFLTGLLADVQKVTPKGGHTLTGVDTTNKRKRP